MDVKEKLKECKFSIRNYNVDKSTLEDTIEILKANEYSCTAKLTDMPRGSGVTDKTKITDERMLLEQELERKKLFFNMIYSEASEIINLLPSSLHKNIFIKHYIHDKKWKVVAKEMNFCYSRIQDFHGEGIEHLRKVYKNRRED